jgi:splicing factor 45
MVGRGQVDPDLQSETAEECSKFGPVARVYVDEAKDLTVDDEEAVRIFVCFEAVESALAAISDLNGRFFAGRKVKASYYDDSRFVQACYRDIIV